MPEGAVNQNVHEHDCIWLTRTIALTLQSSANILKQPELYVNENTMIWIWKKKKEQEEIKNLNAFFFYSKII